MIVSPSLEKLKLLVSHQIHNLFILDDNEREILPRSIESALDSLKICFQTTRNKYYRKDGNLFFSAYHSGQYCIFLYFLSRHIYLNCENHRDLADKIYYLNKSLNGLDLYYEVEMPETFNLDHPVGTVMGRATYGENFTFSQLCTVGNNKGIYPTIGENVTMMSGSKSLGNCKIGNNVIISANAYVKDTSIPDNSIVFGSSPALTIKKRKDL